MVNLKEYPIAGLSNELEISYGVALNHRSLIEPYGTVSRLNFVNQLKLGVRITEVKLGLSRFFFDVSSFVSKEKKRANTGMFLESRLTF